MIILLKKTKQVACFTLSKIILGCGYYYLDSNSLTVVCAVSSVLAFLFGLVGGAIGGVLVAYANCKGRRGKLDLTPAGPLYEDVGAPPPCHCSSSL